VDRLFHAGRILVLAFVAWGIFAARGASIEPQVSARDEAVARQRIERFVRDKFGIPGGVKVIVWPLLESGHADFYQTTVTLESTGQRKNQMAFLSRDLQHLILGDSYPLGPDPRSSIEQRVRELSKLPATARVEVGEFRPTIVPHLLISRVTVDTGSEKRAHDLYLTEDKTLLFAGEIGDITSDVRAKFRRAISLQNCPSVGPAGAPVTIVEFSDLECPSCAAFHEFLVKELLPKYRGKVRVVFKEFPLARIHPWTLSGSIANQCAFRQDPAAYVRFRGLIFHQQNAINASNARDRLLSLGEEAGVNRVQLAACLDSKATLQKINQDVQEGEAVGIHSTPTTFINGRMEIGMLPKNEYYKVVDEALAEASRARK
jgi:protein-disulfide isomerase